MNTLTLRAAVTGLALAMAAAQADIARDTLPDVERAVPRGAPPAAEPKSPDVDVSRGQLLYENHCRGCHESIVHVREARKATSPAAVEAWVRRWSDTLKLDWRDTDVAAVADYLSRRFYKFERAR